MKNTILILTIGIFLFTACSKDPINTPTVDPSTMKIISASDFTGADGDTVSFKFIPLNAGGGVVSGATVTWTCDNTTIGIAASGTGDIPTFTVKNKGTSLAIAHIVATPVLNGSKGNPLTVTVQVTAAGNTFTMLNSLPLSTGVIPYHWYSDAGKLYYGGTPKLYWNTPSDTSSLYYGIVYKNNMAGATIQTFGPGTNYDSKIGVLINTSLSDTVTAVFKIIKTDPSVYPVGVKLNFIDYGLEHDKVFGGNQASFGALNDSLIVDVSKRVTVQGQFSKIDKTKPLTIYSFPSGNTTTDYCVVPFVISNVLNLSGKSSCNLIVSVSLSDGTTYKVDLVNGIAIRP